MLAWAYFFEDSNILPGLKSYWLLPDTWLFQFSFDKDSGCIPTQNCSSGKEYKHYELWRIDRQVLLLPIVSPVEGVEDGEAAGEEEAAYLVNADGAALIQVVADSPSLPSATAAAGRRQAAQRRPATAAAAVAAAARQAVAFGRVLVVGPAGLLLLAHLPLLCLKLKNK